MQVIYEMGLKAEQQDAAGCLHAFLERQYVAPLAIGAEYLAVQSVGDSGAIRRPSIYPAPVRPGM